MNKKLIALAVASALVAPIAMADSGNVKISGQLNLSYDVIKGNAGGTDNQSMSNVSSNASNIAFSGDEDLGNGLKAVWQLQTYTSVGGTGNSDGTTSTADGIGSGNSFLGLTGGFGGVYLGKNDTPFKTIGRKVDLFGNTLGDSRNLITGATLVGTGTSAADAAAAAQSWDLRPNNMVWYVSPSMSGFQVIGGYITNVGSGANNTGATSATSVAAIYANGPVFAGLAWEKHQPGGSNNAPKAWRLSGGYDFGVAKVVALWETTKDNTALANRDDDRKVWGLGAAFKLDAANTLKAQYYKAGNIGNTSNTGASMWAIGADHAMSKRTTAYVGYARTANKSGDVGTGYSVMPAYSVSASGHGDNPGSVATQATSGLTVGMIHNF